MGGGPKRAASVGNPSRSSGSTSGSTGSPLIVGGYTGASSVGSSGSITRGLTADAAATNSLSLLYSMAPSSVNSYSN